MSAVDESMSAVDEVGHDRAAGSRAPRRQSAKVGLQGEALILELQSVKRTLERSRLAASCQPASPRRRPGAKPEAIVRQFPRSSERLDRFDQNLLRQPVGAGRTSEEPAAAGQTVERPQVSEFK